MAITREDLLAAAKNGLQVVEREHPTLGTMRLRELSARQRVDWQQHAQAEGKAAEVAAYVLSVSLVDDKGKPILRNEAEALRWLDDVPSAISDPIFEAIFDLNGLSQQATEAMRENFPNAQSGASLSD